MKISSTSRLHVVQRTGAKKTIKVWFISFAILWLVVLVAFGAIALGNPPPVAGFRAGRVLVKPKPDSDLTALHAALGTTVYRSYPAFGNWQIVQLPQNASVTDFLALFQQSGLVQYAEPDYAVPALLAPNEPRYNEGSLWGLHNIGAAGICQDQMPAAGSDIHAADAWDIQTTANNIIVAVVDTGVRLTHKDLALNLWTNPGEIPGNGIDDDGNGYVDDVHGINAITGSGNPSDDHGHGTHVAGIIGARGNNGIGVVGVCWQVKIMACKFLDPSPAPHGFVSDAIECIHYAGTQGAKIINASWGDYFTDPFNGILPGLHNSSANSRALHDAIANARDAGIIFVAACGNNGTDNDVHPLYPASYSVDNNHGEEYLPALDNIIAVAATDSHDQVAVFPAPNQASNYGATTVHLGAPGLNIYSCWNGSDSQYACDWGTSMAAPHVAGACALVWAKYPNETYQQIIHRVLVSTDGLPSLAGKCRTGGRLNLLKALTIPGAWQPTAPMRTKRYYHTATLLNDGRVLVAGGFNSTDGILGKAEVYDPATGSWTDTANFMTTARYLHTATLLNDGRVLVAGGEGSSGYLQSAELYDPVTGNWTETGNLIGPGRALHAATRLTGGNVLVAGGQGVSGYLANAELYDPISGWSAANPLNTGRKQHTATLLGSGAVLAAGGNDANAMASAEVYADGAWTTTTSMTSARQNHTATLLSDGRVLLAGGDQIPDERDQIPEELVHASAELYDAGTWTPTNPMKVARTSHTATLLSDRKVLVAGGDDGSGALRSSEFYAAGDWTTTGAMADARMGHTATLLPSGKVLVAGGWNSVAGELLSAELYVP